MGTTVHTHKFLWFFVAQAVVPSYITNGAYTTHMIRAYGKTADRAVERIRLKIERHDRSEDKRRAKDHHQTWTIR